MSKGRKNDSRSFVNTVADKSATQAILEKQDSVIDQINAQSDIISILSDAGAGGAASEAMTVTGLLATDEIIAVCQEVDNANSLPLLAFNTQADDALTCEWSADPGAGAKVRVTVKRARTAISKVSLD